MPIDAVIPFRPVNPKTRLSDIMDQQEREAFARIMLGDVICALRGAGCSPCILCTTAYHHPGARTCIDEQGLNEALNDYLAGCGIGPVLIFMSDLPLATAEGIRRVTATDRDIAIVPGRGGGTNVIFIRDPSRFRVDFYGASFCDHLAIAKAADLSVDVVDSFFMSTDIDEREDLVEILLHAKGESRGFLQGIGVGLSLETGRVSVQRSPHE
ncbi:MAG TPA: 2-phospho-L-lactate guanylyltransferase [Methanoculleus sp.]|nr:2-phospho-L-lactate guanylyltransferase [Methanoculleus sp.]